MSQWLSQLPESGARRVLQFHSPENRSTLKQVSLSTYVHLLSDLVGRVCMVCVYSDRRPVYGSCRQSVCVYTLTGDLFTGLVGRVCMVCVCTLTGDLFTGLVGRVSGVCTLTGDLFTGLVGRVCGVCTLTGFRVTGVVGVGCVCVLCPATCLRVL